MNSNILETMGLGQIDIGLILIITLALLLVCIILTIVFIVKEEKLKKKYNRFLRGNNAKSLEEEIVKVFADNRDIKAATLKNRRDIDDLNRRFERGFQKIGIIKYDAYQQMGGLLSFSLAMLDEEDNGFIINSIHSNEGGYTYIKEVINGQCATELGNEERMALEKAIEGKDIY